MAAEIPLTRADTQLSEKTYKKRTLSWAWYDWADHAYVTTTASTFFPPYFIAIAAPALLATGASATDKVAIQDLFTGCQ